MIHRLEQEFKMLNLSTLLHIKYLGEENMAGHFVLLQRIFMIAVNTVSLAIRISSPGLVQHQWALLLFTQTLFICNRKRN